MRLDMYHSTCTAARRRLVSNQTRLPLGNLFWLLQPPRLINMALRCLLFASDEATAEPLWRVITELGMEGEHCRKALEAVETLANHRFHIVIADWDEAEASFLLKTARELKAAQRPLTLAIIKDEATVPKALQAVAHYFFHPPSGFTPVQNTHIPPPINPPRDHLLSPNKK